MQIVRTWLGKCLFAILYAALLSCSQQSPGLGTGSNQQNTDLSDGLSSDNNSGNGGADVPGSDAGDGGSSSMDPSPRWFASWGTAIYTSFPNGPLTQQGFSPNTAAFTNNEAVEQSFRMMIHPTIAGDRVRFRFSNAYGDRPLVVQNVSVALRAGPGAPAIVATSSVPVTFARNADITIPAGEHVTSDGAEFAYAFGDDLAVSFHIPGPSGPISWHAEAFAGQFISAPNSGDVTGDASGASFSNPDRGWFFLAGMDSQLESANLNGTNPEPFSIAVFGDSITDGFVSTPERNERYPDFLARRLQSAGITAGVVNLGINSNSVTPARDPVTTGEPGIDRFDRDALTRSGVRSVFILLGTNDLSSGIDADTVYAGLVELANQAHAAGVCTVVSTISPRNDPPVPFGWDAATEEPERQRLNQMILNSTDFDAVADVAEAMENPLVDNQPFQPFFVEGLHPNSVGMEALAAAIPLAPLLPQPLGSCAR